MLEQTSATIKLRILYSILLLKEFNALSTEELAKFLEVSPEMMQQVVKIMEEEALIVKQGNRYQLTEKGEKMYHLYDLFFI
ncbi:MAG: winged helix-turn-helix domain-containing protein [Candidatus Hermodarchaeota archaeon]